MESDDFEALKRLIEKTLKIQCRNYKEAYIKRRLLSRMRSTGVDTYDQYLKYLKDHPAEFEALRNALTINVTEFFRDPEVFDLIQKGLIPSLAQERGKVRIWCAGCSSGEEAYTLAILLHEALGTTGARNSMIYATDIDEVILSRAKTGLYEEKALQKVPEALLKRHFTKRDDGQFEVRPHLRSVIRFSRHDLMTGQPVARFLDMISCRNVTIYFTEGQKNDLAHLFHGALSPGGFYVMGKTEYLSREVEHLFTTHNSIQKVFVRNT
jgi:chemotaxis protein methyltransferase CheR